MKKRIYIIISLMLVLGIVFGGVYTASLNRKKIDTAYNNAVTLIQKGSYKAALGKLEKANPDKIDRDNFWIDAEYGYIEKLYKDSLPLYAYALAQIEYNGEKSMVAVYEYLNLIPKSYSGELSKEIKTFRENFQSEYDVYLAEEARKKAEREQEQRLSYKNKIPYVGMSETYISDTVMGKYHDYESTLVGKGTRRQNIWHKYYWKTDAGKTILIVTCVDDKVTSVLKYYDTTQWTSDGKPIYKQKGSSSSYNSSSKKSGTKKSDPYNAKDYYDAEDFYDDYYDDFYDYEEAEEYYNENGMW